MPDLRPVLVMLLVIVGPVAAQVSSPPATRGQLLYDNHCQACHSVQLHWRERKQATDWRSLKEQVRRWQAAGQLDWSEADIVEVTRHLNDTIYHFPGGTEQAGRSGVRVEQLTGARIDARQRQAHLEPEAAFGDIGQLHRAAQHPRALAHAQQAM